MVFVRRTEVRSLPATGRWRLFAEVAVDVRRPGSILAALFAAGVLASVGFVVPGATAARTGPVPKVVLIVGPAGAPRTAIAPRPAPPQRRPEVHARRDRGLLPERHVARGQGRAPGRVAGRVHGPRQRLAQPVPRHALPADPGRLRAQPVRGSGDDAHQYYGEGRIASSVHLAKDAVVLLHHLCYASGLSEPGLPEGTMDVPSSASTTSPAASSPRARRPSSPRPTRARPAT